MAYPTNSFSIAHYILLICMVVACGGIVAYAIMHDTRSISMNDTLPMPTVVPVSAPTDKCSETITNAVAQMWAYNPDAIPEKYRNMAAAYYISPVEATIHGDCNGTTFICNRGVRRSDCDPCAAGSAREFAISVQTRDMIEKYCNK